MGEFTNSKNSLWKWGGHPQVLRTELCANLEQQLIGIANKAEMSLPGTPHTHPPTTPDHTPDHTQKYLLTY